MPLKIPTTHKVLDTSGERQSLARKTKDELIAELRGNVTLKQYGRIINDQITQRELLKSPELRYIVDVYQELSRRERKSQSQLLM